MKRTYPLKNVKGVRLLMYICTYGGIHPRRVEPASPMEFAACLNEVAATRRSRASSQENATQPVFHRGPEWDFRSSLRVNAHVISSPPQRGGMGKRKSLLCSGLLEAWPNQRSFRTPLSSSLTSDGLPMKSITGSCLFKFGRSDHWVTICSIIYPLLYIGTGCEHC